MIKIGVDFPPLQIGDDWRIDEDAAGNLEWKYQGTVNLELTSTGVLNLLNGAQIDPGVGTANQCRFTGGDTSGDYFKLISESLNGVPFIELRGNGHAYIRVKTNNAIYLQAGTSASGTQALAVFDADGSTIYASKTGVTALMGDFDVTTTGTGMLTSLAGLTDGYGHKLIADSDVVTTGRPWAYLGGPSKDYPIKWMNLWGRPDFEDDFLGAALDARWTPVIAGTGAAVVIVNGTGGQHRLSTGALTGGGVTFTFGTFNYVSDKHCIIEWLVHINDVSETDIYLGFYRDADEYAYFHLNNGAVILKADDGGVHTYSADSGQTVSDNTWYLFRVEVDATETPTFYMDAVVLGTPTVGSVTANNLGPYAFVVNTSDNTVYLDLDWVKIWQDK